jgi:RecB family exonuclease
MRAVRTASSRPAAPRKPTLSPTRIRTYLECALKYRFVYIDKIGKFYLRSRAGFSFGSTLHHVLQEFHEAGATHTPEEMVTRLETNWIGAGYESEEQEQRHRAAGEEIVQAYHAAHQERREQQVETWATEKTLTCDMGRFKLSGRVDRIDRHADGRLEIIDYKSGRQETTPEEVAGSLAMNIYQLILRRLYPDTPVFATIYCLRSGVQASYALEGETLNAFERDLVALGDTILDTDYAPLTPVRVPACEDCDFYARCARFWRQQSQETDLDAPHFDD